jgi:hypothetical protein
MDQSPAGQEYANELAAGCAPVEERLSRWRASNDVFFVFFLEQREGGRARSRTTKDIDHLLSNVLPTLFQQHLMPSAIPGFGVAAEEAGRIWTEIERLKTAASASSAHRNQADKWSRYFFANLLSG